SPHTCEDHAHRHDARQQQTLVRSRHVTTTHHHTSEDKHKHHRLQKRLQHQWNKVTSRDTSITRKQGPKSFPVHTLVAQAPSSVVQEQVFETRLRNVYVRQLNRRGGREARDLRNE